MTHKHIDNFAGNLRAIRTSQGLSLRPLAKRAGVSFNAISEIENRKTEPSLLTALRIAKALGCSLDHMLQDHGKGAAMTYAGDRQKYPVYSSTAGAVAQSDFTHQTEATDPAATEVKRLSRAHAAAMSQADYWQERCLSAEATRDRLQAALDAMQTIEKLDHLLREGAKVIRVVVESSQHSLEEVIFGEFARTNESMGLLIRDGGDD